MNRRLPHSQDERRRKTTMIFVLIAIIVLGALAIAADMYRHPGTPNRGGAFPPDTATATPQ
jgi:hypothetical protein